MGLEELATFVEAVEAGSLAERTLRPLMSSWRWRAPFATRRSFSGIASTAALVAAPLTGGATLALLVPIGIVGSIPSAYRLLDRGAAGTFGLDFAAAMEIVDVVGSLAGLGQAAAGMAR